MDDKSIDSLANGGIRRLIFRYSAPTIISTVANATYNVVDRIFVGRACGEDALAAITVCFPPALFLLAIAMTVGQGSATLVSIKLGERDKRGAERVLGQAIFLFFAFYVLTAGSVLTFMDDFLRFFGATEKILPAARDYYTIIIAGLIFEKVSFGMNNLIRAEGRPMFSMGTIVIGCLVNIVLDYVFLFRLGWGVRGAAIATVAAQACATLWVCAFYFSGKSYLKVRLQNIRANLGLTASMIYAGSPSFIIQALSSVSMMLFVRQARLYGSESAIAVIGISLTVTTFMFLPVVGLAMGAQPIAGFNWGAKNYARVKSAYLNSLAIGTAMCCAGFVVAQIFPDLIFALFLGFDSVLAPMGERALRILTLAFPFIGLNIVTSGYFQSVKRPKISIFITVLRQAVCLVPFLFILPRFLGLDGIWGSFPAADLVSCAFTAIVAVREVRRLNAAHASLSRVS